MQDSPQELRLPTPSNRNPVGISADVKSFQMSLFLSFISVYVGMFSAQWWEVLTIACAPEADVRIGLFVSVLDTLQC